MVATAEHVPLTLRGPVADLYLALSEERWDDIAHENCLWGGAGTGKSFQWLASLVLLCMDRRRGGLRILWCRKTRKAITQSSLVTLRKVYEAIGIPWNEKPAPKDRQEETYHTPAGVNKIVWCGLDSPMNAFSAEYDIVVFEEMLQIGIATYEMASIRCLRNFAIPVQFVVGITNPGSKAGWIYKRMFGKNPRLKSLRTTIYDNPAYYDVETESMSDRGASYVGGMEGSYTGNRKLKMLRGEWVSEEGAILDNYEEEVHGFSGDVIIDRHRAPRIVLSTPHETLDDLIRLEWTFGSVDHGFVNAGVVLIWGVDTEGRLYLLEEVYHTRRDRDWWARSIVTLAGKYRCRCFVTDHDPERHEHWNKQIRLELPDLAHPADGEPYIRNCEKSRGDKDELKVEVVRTLLNDGVDGRPMCFLNVNSRKHAPDPELLEASKATTIHEEIPELVWKDLDEDQADERLPEEKIHPRCANHGFDAWVYAARFLRAHKVRTDWARGRPVHDPGTLEAHIDHMEKRWKKAE